MIAALSAANAVVLHSGRVNRLSLHGLLPRACSLIDRRVADWHATFLSSLLLSSRVVMRRSNVWLQVSTRSADAVHGSCRLCLRSKVQLNIVTDVSR
jgi:hypothetical protein